MVLFDKWIVELSSALMASVTLNKVLAESATPPLASIQTYINWLGFFFFFRIAVAVSSSCSTKSASESTVVANATGTNIFALGTRSITANRC